MNRILLPAMDIEEKSEDRAVIAFSSSFRELLSMIRPGIESDRYGEQIDECDILIIRVRVCHGATSSVIIGLNRSPPPYELFVPIRRNSLIAISAEGNGCQILRRNSNRNKAALNWSRALLSCISGEFLPGLG